VLSGILVVVVTVVAMIVVVLLVSTILTIIIRHFVSFESTGHNENYDDSSNVSVVISNSSKCCNNCTIV